MVKDQPTLHTYGPEMEKLPDRTSSAEEVRRKAIHQPKDKNAKEFYGDPAMTREFLDQHLPRDLLPKVDVSRVVKASTEYIDPKFRTARYVDLVWRVPFRESWLYLLVLFEAQSTVDWQMPVRILLEVALLYQEALKDPQVQRKKRLPPVLPIVVHVGTEPWNAPTSLEALLPDEAASFLPFALGGKFLLVSEADEARTLERADTPRTAALKLRYARNRREFQEALETLQQLLPEDSPTRQVLVAWVRSSLIDYGAEEEDMAELRKLEDLGRPVVEAFWATEWREARQKGREEGREEGRKEGRKEGLEEGRKEGLREGLREGEAQARHRLRAVLVRQARRKFGTETAEALDAVLEGVSDGERVDEGADVVVDCGSGRDLLPRAAGDDPGSG